MNTIVLFVARMAGALTRLEVRALAKGAWLTYRPVRDTLALFELIVPSATVEPHGWIVWRRSALGDELLRVLGIDPLPA